MLLQFLHGCHLFQIDISTYMEAAFGRKIPDTEIVLLTVPDYLSKMNEIVRTSTNVYVISSVSTLHVYVCFSQEPLPLQHKPYT